MKLLIKIFWGSLIFCACANNSEDTSKSVTSDTTEVRIQKYIDSLDNTSIVNEEDTDVELLDSKTTTSVPSTKKPTEIIAEDSESKRKPNSSIAQQQEAARRIQDELLNRSPLPNEEEVQKGAVFNKVISATKKKEEPKSTKAEEKKKATTVKKTTKKVYPAIEFIETKMSFDTILQGDIIDHKFIFTNTGNAPLEIKSASATCGCTQPSFPFIPIEPNEKGHINVQYNSVGKEGFQNPEISIKTNINSKEIILYMEGYVVKKKSEEEEGGK